MNHDRVQPLSVKYTPPNLSHFRNTSKRKECGRVAFDNMLLASKEIAS
jgi:hypothetical protein